MQHIDQEQSRENKLARIEAADKAGDLYRILDVERSADQADLKEAYRSLAMDFHPDRNPDDEAAEAAFKSLSTAYGVLSDDDKRARYDKFGKDSPGSNSKASDPFGFDDIFNRGYSDDLFSDLFGTKSRGRNIDPKELVQTLVKENRISDATSEYQERGLSREQFVDICSGALTTALDGKIERFSNHPKWRTLVNELKDFPELLEHPAVTTAAAQRLSRVSRSSRHIDSASPLAEASSLLRQFPQLEPHKNEALQALTENHLRFQDGSNLYFDTNDFFKYLCANESEFLHSEKGQEAVTKYIEVAIGSRDTDKVKELLETDPSLKDCLEQGAANWLSNADLDNSVKQVEVTKILKDDYLDVAQLVTDPKCLAQAARVVENHRSHGRIEEALEVAQGIESLTNPLFQSIADGLEASLQTDIDRSVGRRGLAYRSLIQLGDSLSDFIDRTEIAETISRVVGNLIEKGDIQEAAALSPQDPKLVSHLEEMVPEIQSNLVRFGEKMDYTVSWYNVRDEIHKYIESNSDAIQAYGAGVEPPSDLQDFTTRIATEGGYKGNKALDALLELSPTLEAAAEIGRTKHVEVKIGSLSGKLNRSRGSSTIDEVKDFHDFLTEETERVHVLAKNPEFRETIAGAIRDVSLIRTWGIPLIESIAKIHPELESVAQASVSAGIKETADSQLRSFKMHGYTNPGLPMKSFREELTALADRLPAAVEVSEVRESLATLVREIATHNVSDCQEVSEILIELHPEISEAKTNGGIARIENLINDIVTVTGYDTEPKASSIDTTFLLNEMQRRPEDVGNYAAISGNMEKLRSAREAIERSYSKDAAPAIAKLDKILST